MVSGFTNLLTRIVINTLPAIWIITTCIDKAQSYGSVAFLQTLPVCSMLITHPFSMDPMVRVELNGVHTLLSYDNAREDLERNGWHLFIEKFQGFNLQVAQEFALTFDGCREKIGDVQLEVVEEKFLAEEDPVSFGLYPDRPYDYVNNMPPCLKDNPEFPGI